MSETLNEETKAPQTPSLRTVLADYIRACLKEGKAPEPAVLECYTRLEEMESAQLRQRLIQDQVSATLAKLCETVGEAVTRIEKIKQPPMLGSDFAPTESTPAQKAYEAWMKATLELYHAGEDDRAQALEACKAAEAAYVEAITQEETEAAERTLREQELYALQESIATQRAGGGSPEHIAELHKKLVALRIARRRAHEHRAYVIA